MFIFLSACSLLVPLSMIILGYTWKDKPPKDRQGSSGYRTTMSRMNDETWRYAHRCWGWINFVLGIILVILSIFILILTKDDTNFEMISVYLVFLQLGIMVLTIIPTEFLEAWCNTDIGVFRIFSIWISCACSCKYNTCFFCLGNNSFCTSFH